MKTAGEQYGYGRFVEGGVDLSKWQPPERIRTADDGSTVVEKVPSMLHIKMLSPAGSVVRVALANGMGPQSVSDPYKNRTLAVKQLAGFLPYARCPKAAGLGHLIPKALQDTPPCKLADDGHAIGPEHACKCIVETQKARLAKHNKTMVEVEERHLKQETRETRQREALIDKQSQVFEKLTEVVEAMNKPKKEKL